MDASRKDISLAFSKILDKRMYQKVGEFKETSNL